MGARPSPVTEACQFFLETTWHAVGGEIRIPVHVHYLSSQAKGASYF